MEVLELKGFHTTNTVAKTPDDLSIDENYPSCLGRGYYFFSKFVYAENWRKIRNLKYLIMARIIAQDSSILYLNNQENIFALKSIMQNVRYIGGNFDNERIFLNICVDYLMSDKHSKIVWYTVTEQDFELYKILFDMPYYDFKKIINSEQFCVKDKDLLCKEDFKSFQIYNIEEVV